MSEISFLQSVVPADGEWFDLEVDNDINPIDVVKFARLNHANWKYLCPKLEGKYTYKVKLIRLGCFYSLDNAMKKVDELGYRLVEGQAQIPFMKKFPKPNSRGRVVFGGSEWYLNSKWESINKRPTVAILGNSGRKWIPNFYYSDNKFSNVWRWLVVDR
jgi:hypothetical protein